MKLACLLFGIVFVAIGILFAMGKIHPHLSFYQKMTPAEKESIRIVSLCRNIGGVIALAGILLLLKGTLKFFTDPYFLFAVILWLIFAGGDAYWISKSGRFRK